MSAPTETQPARPAGNRILAIDGPAGAGKSTVAARMAARFGLVNLETGAMYRAFAWKALAHGADLDCEPALAPLTASTRIDLLPGPDGNRVVLDGEDVSGRLRTAEVAGAASRVSVHPSVRAWLVGLQQRMGAALPPGARGVVMEGRDIGTVVFPEASIKIFLLASAEARAERRLLQEDSLDRAATLRAIRARDARDAGRAASPLHPADDAVRIDSTALGLEDVVERVAALVRARWGL